MPAFQRASETLWHRLAYPLAAVFAVALGATLYAALQPRPLVTTQAASATVAGHAVGTIPIASWPYFGRTASGTRHAPLDQVTQANVEQLQVAWTYRTGEIPKGSAGHVVTPLHVNGML